MSSLLFWIARKILKDDFLAEDAVQEAFIRIAKNFSKISKKNPIACNKTKSFIVIIVERAAIDIYRKRKKTAEREISSDRFEETTFILEDLNQVEGNRVLEAIRTLPKKCGEVMMLYYVNELSCKEISRVLELKETAVRVNLLRGRRRLEVMLSDLLLERERGSE